jgi:preprotein translocase subunit Sss1
MIFLEFVAVMAAVSLGFALLGVVGFLCSWAAYWAGVLR